MIRNHCLELVTLAAILTFTGIFLFVSANGTHAFGGSDDAGSQKIAELIGRPADSFKPLIPQYEPPGTEIEGTLFALQAASGGLVVGLIFGYWLGQKKKTISS